MNPTTSVNVGLSRCNALGRLAQVLCTLAMLSIWMATLNVHAAAFRCPSADAISYFVYLDAPSREAALDKAQSSWDFKFLEKPKVCMTEPEFEAAYREAFANSPQFKARRTSPSEAASKVAENKCGAVPLDGDPKLVAASLVLEAPPGCDRMLNVAQQLFVGGASEQLMSQCNISATELDERVNSFVVLESLGAAGGLRPVTIGRGPDNAFSSTAQLLTESQTPFLAGKAYASTLGIAACKSGLSKRWFAGLKRYLAESSQPPRAKFVDSCLNFYRDTVSRTRCSCVAEVLRVSDSGIHDRYFSPDQLRDGVKLTVLGVPLVACGIISFERPPLPKPAQDAAAKNSAKLRDCDRYTKQGMGTKVPEERDALMERCMRN